MTRKLPKRKLAAELCVDLLQVGVRDEIIDWSVDAEGTICVLTANHLPQYREGDGCFFQRSSRKPNRFTVHVMGADCIRHVAIPPTRENFTEARTVGDDEVLLVLGRWQAGDRPNGLIVDYRGKTRRRIMLGDAIHYVRVMRDRRIWLGYFDEAWLKPESHGGGIAQIDAHGNPCFVLERPKWDCMDCYAMTEDEAGRLVAAFYPSRRLVCVSHEGRIRARTKAQLRDLTHTLVVSGHHALIDRGFLRRREYRKLNLRTGRSHPVRIVDMKGRALREPECFGVGGRAYFRIEHRIYVARIDGARSVTPGRLLHADL